MQIFYYIILILIIALGVTFATLNSTHVTVNYYIGHKTLALSLLLGAVFVAGCLLGVLVGLWLVVKTKIKNYRLRQRLILAEKEIENLRAIPLLDKH